MTAAEIVTRELIRGWRDHCQRARRPVLADDAPAFPLWLADVCATDSELILELVRDAGVRLRRDDGQAVIIVPNATPMLVPSRAAALYLADLCHRWTGEIPSDHAVRHVMALLLERTRREAA